MNVVIFSGTTEGRSFSRALAALGASVTVCVATELGAEEQGCADGITVRTGRLDAEGMTALLRGAALCVDATHPYAAEATRNIRAAAAAAGVEYHRLLRPASPLPAGSVVLTDAARAAAYLADRPGRVLLATGAKELPAFAALDPARLYPRVLPTLAGIAACEAAGIPHRNILAMQGPFTKELNAALLHQFHIDYMVTKDGGAAGGFAEKAEAAARCGVQLIVLPGRRGRDNGHDFTAMQGAFMKITLVGMGSGAPGSLTAAGLEALRGAELIIGARRLLENLPEGCTANRAALYKTDEICALLRQTDCAETAVVFSGDTGFYSGAAALCRALDDAGLPYTVLPGVSSVQLLSAALGRPWQGWRLVSAHGCACDPVAACRAGGTTFFLTGGSETPATLCQQLAAAGLGDAAATVGENLGTPSQRLVTGRAQELAAQRFAPLSVLLVENVPAPLRRTPGLPDAAFIRGKTPMTKQEVRAAALAKLAVRPTDTLWDVGAGTGSVSVELALAAPAGRVCAVECDAEACDLIRQNRAKFAVQNLHLTEGLAPAALAGWPTPDAVFIGGSKGSLRAVVDAALAANPDARLCISAIALETLQEAVAALTAHGLTAQVTQIAVSRSRAAGSLHLLMANNPVFLIARE